MLSKCSKPTINYRSRHSFAVRFWSCSTRFPRVSFRQRHRFLVRARLRITRKLIFSSVSWPKRRLPKLNVSVQTVMPIRAGWLWQSTNMPSSFGRKLMTRNDRQQPCEELEESIRGWESRNELLSTLFDRRSFVRLSPVFVATWRRAMNSVRSTCSSAIPIRHGRTAMRH